MHSSYKLIMNVKFYFALAVVLPSLSCDLGNQKVDGLSNARPDCNSCSVLFIGSSYLSYIGNDVMEIFQLFADKAGKEVYVDDRSLGGWQLRDHSESEQTIAKIEERKWDYIILQGNSAYLSQEKWHQYVVPYIVELRKIIKENYKKTCVIYMMPWAYLDGLSWIEGETDTYQQMQVNLFNETTKLVKEIDIATAPAGWAWYRAYLEEYEPDLYIEDFNHQTQNGAYLTACVFYSTIFLERAPAIIYDWREENDAPYLNQLADSVVNNDLDLWNIY